MRTSIKSKLYSVSAGITIAAIAAMISLTNQVWAAPAGAAHRSLLTGPWELVVKMGMEKTGLLFPVTVSDENKSEKLDRILPVMGMPVNIRLERYVPDLKWETTVVEQPGGMIVAKLTVKGKDLEQDIWLSPGDPDRQSISSSIGSVAIKKIHNANIIEKLVRELTRPRAVGIISVWLGDTNSPLEYAANPAETITMPKSKYKLSVLEYVPHYSIDTETKEVVSRSDKPVNPAIKVGVDDGENTYEQWLWSKFPSSPHKETELALRMEFTSFDLGGTEGKYILVVADGSEPWLLFSNKGKTQTEKATFGRAYPFTDKEYSFSIEKIFDSAVVKTDWKNKSENLLNPAIIATIEYDGTAQQAVLEFNKPYHYKTKFGTMVLLYKRQKSSY